MSRTIRLASVMIAVCFGLISCFEVREEVTFNSNGSGTYSFSLDLSQLKQFFDMSAGIRQAMVKNDSTGVVRQQPIENPITQMKYKFEMMEGVLESVKGISNYQVIYDTATFLIGAKYDFASIEALNNSINILQAQNNNGVSTDDQMSVKHFLYSGNTIERYATVSKEDLGGQLSRNDSMATAFLSKSKYSIVYHFDRKIKTYENPNYYMSQDGKSVIFTGSLLDIVNGKLSIENKIKF